MLKLLYLFVKPWAKASGFRLFVNRIMGGIANCLYPIYIKLSKPKMVDKTNCDRNYLIVSLTTFPERIDSVVLTLGSLFRQTMMPNEIILWLAKEQFPDNCLPEKIKQYEKYGLTIRFCDDIRSYKKILYAAIEKPEFDIVTVDDDVLYPENWLERLVRTKEKHVNCVCCYRAHEMKFENDGVLDYCDWNGLSPDIKGPSQYLVPIGVGGVLYPAGYFCNVTIDKEIITELSPLSDDLWLKTIGLLKGIPAVKVDENSKEWFTVRKSQKKALMDLNVSERQNDIAIHKLFNYYGIDLHSIEMNEKDRK